MQMIRCKEDIKDSVRTYFAKGKSYAIEDATILGGVKQYVTTNNAGFRLYMDETYMLRHFDLVQRSRKIDKVYLVFGGCLGDEHVIAVYYDEKLAKKRMEKENEKLHGLCAYYECWNVEK